MTRNDFRRLLTDGSIPPVLLFEGTDEYLKREAWQSLRAAILPAGMEELNEAVLDAPETDELIAAAETLPFMADRRLVLVRDMAGLSGRGEGDDRLADYLRNASPTSVIVFYCAGKPDGRKKLYTVIKKLNGIVTFDPMTDRELTAFVSGAFSDLGRECDERTAGYLIFTCGTDADLLMGEISKIASHGQAGVPVHPDEITALATRSTECTVFQMVDAVVAGQSSRALSLLRNLLLNGADRVFILAMRLRQFRIRRHIRTMQYEKKSNSYIRGALSLPSFAADQYFRQAASFTAVQIRDAVNVCFETEYGIKSGRLNADGAVEGAMLKLLTLRKKD